ncbi:hypothetical protein Droror1_Dr00017957 [Drosera rotundifolia]
MRIIRDETKEISLPNVKMNAITLLDCCDLAFFERTNSGASFPPSGRRMRRRWGGGGAAGDRWGRRRLCRDAAGRLGPAGSAAARLGPAGSAGKAAPLGISPGRRRLRLVESGLGLSPPISLPRFFHAEF